MRDSATIQQSVNNYYRIPEELRNTRQWLLWKHELRNGKWTKVPYNPHTGWSASATNPESWGSFEQAVQAISARPGFDGIGFVFTENDPYCGIDLDNKNNDPALRSQHEAILSAFPSYTEVSPSGKGHHIIIKGTVSKGLNASGVEIYSTGRYFTMTGNVYKNLLIAECQPALLDLWQRYGGKEPVLAKQQEHNIKSSPAMQSDAEVIQRILQSEKCAAKFQSLCNGESHLLESFDRSNSAIDMSLLGIISCFTKSEGQIERIWLSTKIGQREKTQNNTEYRRLTIAKALQPPYPDIKLIDRNTNQAEGPQPLRGKLAPSKPYPIDALGYLLGNAVRSIVDIVQCPVALAANSVLGAASLVVQAHGNVILPATGQSRPLSLFLVSIARSGERKTAADDEALAPIEAYEAELREKYKTSKNDYSIKKAAWDAQKSKINRMKKDCDSMVRELQMLGPEPEQPLLPMIVCSEPTIEGLCKLLPISLPMQGIFANEGGQFVGGHALKQEAKLASAAALSKFWDGSTNKRVRVGDGVSILPGRRIAMHLMIQPEAGAAFFSDPVLRDQGLTSRLLASFPDTTLGTRMQRPQQPNSRQFLDHYKNHLWSILRMPLPLVQGTINELAPPNLHLNAPATQRWEKYADEVEIKLKPYGEYDCISGFAGKLAEHAIRTAGVLTKIDDMKAKDVNLDTINRAILIADYYAYESLRLTNAGMVSPKIANAELLLNWINHEWKEEYIGTSVIMNSGPNKLRDKERTDSAIQTLVEYGHLVEVTQDVLVNGKKVKKAWRIIKSDIANAANPAN